jgi:cyanophycin synthetase
MKILQQKTMRGPNYWSDYWHKLIYVKLDIEGLEGFPTNKIPGFAERLEKLIPTLYQHRCSESHEGGFFERVREGTWMAHVIEHIALELQWLGGMQTGFGKTRSTGEKGIYSVVVSYDIADAGYYAIDAAIRIVEHLISSKPYKMDDDIKEMKRIKARRGLGVTTSAIINEVKKRGIPYKRLNDESLIILGQGVNQRRIQAAMTCATSGIAIDTACDKQLTKILLDKAYIPVPKGEVIYNEEELKEAIVRLGFPLVMKPIDGNHGKGITTKIRTEEQAVVAFHLAKTISDEIIVERFIEGFDYRFLLVNHKLIAAAQRTPALVMGDGFSTIKELIDHANQDSRRGDGHEKPLTTIKVDKVTEEILTAKNYTLSTILPIGEILFLKDTANISTGGTATDVTDLVHPDNIFMAERISRLVNLNICGIDIIAQDIRKPITDETGAIIEVNACPGLRMHLEPYKGLARNVTAPIVDMMYPDEKESRIPLVAVTGTNGKTTTTRLVAHIVKGSGKKVGCTTTDGIYIDGRTICEGDCTGESSALTILTDPMVEFAVLECARGGILRAGLGFDRCSVSIITNVAEDHLGLDDIHTLQEMADVKAVVAKSTFRDGYTILNADDDMVFFIGDDVECKIALFSINPENDRVKRHCERGHLAATIEKGYLTILNGQWKTRICKIADVPLSLGGKAEFMIKNILPAVLAAFVENIGIDDIRQGLMTFIPSPDLLPGRLNLFHFRNFDVLVDYAHNPAGYSELKKFIDQSGARVKVGIISAPGDRRNDDIRQMGCLAAQTFDEIIIRHDEDLRGRTSEEITNLLTEGIKSMKPDTKVQVIPAENDALKYAMVAARRGTLITTLTESVHKVLEFVTNEKHLEETGQLIPAEQ